MKVLYDDLDKLNKELKSKYLFYGDEKYLIDTAIKKIKKQFGELLLGINYILLDETNIDSIISEIESPAFGYDKKLIIAKNTGIFKKAKKNEKMQELLIEKIAETISNMSDTVIVVFVEDEVGKNIIYEKIEKDGIICEIKQLKQVQLAVKLKKICNLYGVGCDESTLNYLIQVSGTNLQNLINEIRKLIEYAGEGGTITIDLIDKLAIKQIDSIIFELADNLAIKKTDKAIQILDNLIYQKEPVQKILVTLYNHFKKLYLCSIAIKLNKDIVNTLNLKPNQVFLVTKYKKQVSYFKDGELREILREFVELDYNSKNGKIDIDIGIRSILCSYCS